MGTEPLECLALAEFQHVRLQAPARRVRADVRDVLTQVEVNETNTAWTASQILCTLACMGATYLPSTSHGAPAGSELPGSRTCAESSATLEVAIAPGPERDGTVLGAQ